MSTLAAPAPVRSGSGAARAATIVSIDALSKRFPVRRSWRQLLRHPASRETVAVLQSVSCEVQQGEFFGLLGANGAGKTTLFKILSTLILPDGGSARICGHDIVGEAAVVRRVLSPVIADERSLNWRLSARENLLLYAALHGLSTRLRRQRVDELLETVELADTGEKIVGSFSSGMRQRLLIARALLPRPRVLLLDEPTRSLDPISARRFRQFLRTEIAGSQGCTILLATHNAEEALDLCDRVAVLDRGRLLAVGTPAALARRPGEERYRIWTRSPAHPCFAALEQRGLLAERQQLETDSDDWTVVEATIPGGPDCAAEVLATLGAERVRVARFETVPFTLADVIEQIVERYGRNEPGVSDG